MPTELALEIVIFLKQPVILLLQALHVATLRAVVGSGAKNARCITIITDYC